MKDFFRFFIGFAFAILDFFILIVYMVGLFFLELYGLVGSLFKKKHLLWGATIFLLPGCAEKLPKPVVIQQVETVGVVRRFLTNPNGAVDGLLLIDGTQVKFPADLAAELISAIALKDKISLKGFRENKILFEAETITNVKTRQSVSVADPIPPDPLPKDRTGMKELKSHGTIQFQLLGRRGEVNGVVLKNGSIVMFGPHLPAEFNVQIGIGKHIRASGYGTRNAYGQSIDAVTLSNF